jgi:DNA (cytosine-5)-methyltransferase 1
LSQILEPSPPKKYYLTRTACLGILRRASERGKELPPQLKAALEIQTGVTPPDCPVGMGAHMNQRDDEGIDLGGVSGAPTAFAANQRDEVRDLHDVAGALGAQPGMKQQTFIAEGCLTPWDTQQERIFSPESKAPTLAGADGGGGRNPAGLVFAAGFSAGQGAAAGGIGYQEEIAPTLKAAESGTNMVPSILCLNDH